MAYFFGHPVYEYAVGTPVVWNILVAEIRSRQDFNPL